MSELILTLPAVEERLTELQAKYGFSTEEFTRKPECRARVADISEEDEFEWDAYIEHRWALCESQEALHREYIQNIQKLKVRKNGAERDYALAA